MRLIYDLGIRLYYLLILAASAYSPKAKRWIRGCRGLWEEIERTVSPGTPVLWFHCSSLGEFEQGRPVIEKIRDEVPGRKILLTFYSPSGFEIRKNYPGADYVFYLPLDTARNAGRFLDLIAVEQAFFVKYEFWYHFLSGLHARKIPVCLVSGIFRKNQVFFRWYGGWFRRMLKCFDHLFVQQDSSLELLESIGIRNASVSGDTRFDRVLETVKNVKEIPAAERFSRGGPVLVAGSTWPPDEKLLCRYINQPGQKMKWILVPHEIHDSHIRRLRQAIQKKTCIYSELKDLPDEDAEVMIIDTVGLLSSLYRYGRIAYIGGGFGRGIHNTLEAAAFGIPVIFGPRHEKFTEAGELIEAGAAFTIKDFEALRVILDRLSGDAGLREKSGRAAAVYIESGTGATSRIVNYVLKK